MRHANDRPFDASLYAKNRCFSGIGQIPPVCGYNPKQGIDPQSVVRSVVFKTSSDKFILLAVAGGGRADWGVLRKHLNERKCRMAEFDEVPEATGYVVGAVPPIALPNDIKVLVDNSVNCYETVVIGSGVLGFALSLKGADFLKLVGDADQGLFTNM